MWQSDEKLIDRIYEASVLPELWSSVLDDITIVGNGYFSALFCLGKGKLSYVASKNGVQIGKDYMAERWPERTDRVYIMADGDRLKTEEFGGDYGPVRNCGNRGCFADDAVYKALVRVCSFKVIGPSRLGGEPLTIEYSARGFTSAFRRLDTQCAKGRLGSWLR